jgi:hypothetical protein
MCPCFSVFVLSYVGRGLVAGPCSSQDSLPDVYKQDSETWKTGGLVPHWSVFP